MPDREHPQTAEPTDDSPYTIAAALGHPLPAPVGAITWVASVSHESGIDTAVFPTENAAVRWVAEYARECWGEGSWSDTNDEDTVSPPADDKQAIAGYFFVTTDTYSIEQKAIRDA